MYTKGKSSKKAISISQNALVISSLILQEKLCNVAISLFLTGLNKEMQKLRGYWITRKCGA